jgi:hypothetical protein
MKALKRYLAVAALAVFTTLFVTNLHYPTRDFAVYPNKVNWDVLTITQYVDVWGIVITSSTMHRAKIVCFDVTIEPATIFQTCHNMRD